MATKSDELLAVHREERRYKPRVRRAFELMARRLRERVPRRELEKAIASRDVKKVMSLFSDERIAEVSNPLYAILRDVLVKAGRIAEKEVNQP